MDAFLNKKARYLILLFQGSFFFKFIFNFVWSQVIPLASLRIRHVVYKQKKLNRIYTVVYHNVYIISKFYGTLKSLCNLFKFLIISKFSLASRNRPGIQSSQKLKKSQLCCVVLLVFFLVLLMWRLFYIDSGRQQFLQFTLSLTTALVSWTQFEPSARKSVARPISAIGTNTLPTKISTCDMI